MSPKELFFKLLNADSEDTVIQILKDEGHWANEDSWRFYGDTKDNYSAAGSQANEAEAALVEKITNCRDARLMLKCFELNINPRSDEAPKTLRQAIAKFFKVQEGTDVAGDIATLDKSTRNKLAQGMTLAVTGLSPGVEKREGYPCITIVDDGEGQTPDDMPDTILSLNRSIKNEIEFTHGKFNMGGTAALTFCGEKNIQLVISKRNQGILTKEQLMKPRSKEWGFTVVRREFPEGKRTKSWYKYLAPIKNSEDQEKPMILSFEANELPLFPESNKPYSRMAEWGTLIKLYNYQTKYRSNAMRDSGILRPLDLLLPEIGLPLRVHECRKGYGGHDGSFANNVNGLFVRLSDENKNLELSEPLTEPIRIEGQLFEMAIFVFKSGKLARTYRKSDKAVIFCLNGQSQGWLSERFFERKSVGMSYLKDSLIVFIDCSKTDYLTQELLFSNSRDRLSTKTIRTKLEREIEDSIKYHPVLKQLREKRRREKTAEKLSNSKPLEDALKSVIKNNKTFLKLFGIGNSNLSSFKPKNVIENEEEYLGKRFPTFFKFKSLADGKKLNKTVHLNKRGRIKFETDVINDYFKRDNSPGEGKLYLIQKDSDPLLYENYKINLANGIATLNLHLPLTAKAGDRFSFKFEVIDNTRIYNPLINYFEIFVLEEQKDNGGGPPKPRDRFPGNTDGKSGSSQSGIQLPENIFEVAESPDKSQMDWKDVPGGEFNEFSAITVISNGQDDDIFNSNSYDWYINVDNKFLINELKSNPMDADLTKAQYIYGLILFGISMLYEESINKKKINSNGELSFEKKMKVFSTAISPVLIPVINELSQIKD